MKGFVVFNDVYDISYYTVITSFSRFAVVSGFLDQPKLMLLVPLIILIFDVFAIQSVIIISCSGVLSQELFVCVCDVSTFDAVTAFNIFLILMLSPLFLVFLLFLVLLFTLFVFFLLSVCCRNIALSVVTDVLPVLYFFCRSF